MPQDEIVFKFNRNNELVLETVQQELKSVQKDIKKFFEGKSIATEFLKTRKGDYDDN